MKTPTIYTTYGSVFGDCGHAHKTLRTAHACVASHDSACKATGGYSDRSVYAEADLLRNAIGDVYGFAVANTKSVKQADGSKLTVDSSKCFFPEGCPGCSNCDRFVPA